MNGGDWLCVREFYPRSSFDEVSTQTMQWHILFGQREDFAKYPALVGWVSFCPHVNCLLCAFYPFYHVPVLELYDMPPILHIIFKFGIENPPYQQP